MLDFGGVFASPREPALRMHMDMECLFLSDSIILAEGAIALPVTLSGGALFAS